MSSQSELAQRSQEKFEFYVVSLTFTLLALTIQTAKFNRSSVEDSLELLGWFALLVAGIVGLWRLEWDAPIRMRLDRRAKMKAQRESVIKGINLGSEEYSSTDIGENRDIQEVVRMHDAAIESHDKTLTTLQRADMLKYKWARYAFVVGVFAIVLSRSIGAAIGLFGYSFS